MDIYLIRHTTPDIDRSICYGQTDLPLKNTFEEEAQLILDQLPNWFDKIYSSPLIRCHTLANAIPANEVIIEPRLRELSFGEWEMQPWKDLPKPAFAHWKQHFVHQAPPKGESMKELQDRVMSWWEEIHQGLTSPVGIVAHFAVIRVFMAALQKTSLEDIFNQELMEYGAVFQLKV